MAYTQKGTISRVQGILQEASTNSSQNALWRMGNAMMAGKAGYEIMTLHAVPD